MKTQIVVVAIPHPTEPNLFLHGLRRDNGKWALPGGHASPGETMLEAARREAREEAGLDLKEMEACRNGCYGDNEVHLFQSKCPANLNLDSSADPDREFLTFKWLDPTHNRNLHVPSSKNILVQHINGISKNENLSKSPLSVEVSKLHDDWTGHNILQSDREKLHAAMMDPMHSKERGAMLRGLAMKVPTQSINGERHYLLHRRHGPVEGNTITHDKTTSYSTHPKDKMKNILSGGNIHSAWIPESKISYSYEFSLPHHQTVPDYSHGHEGEVIVGPGTYPVHEKFYQTSDMKHPVEGHTTKLAASESSEEDLQKNVRLTVEPMLVHDNFDPRKHDFVVKAWQNGKKVGFGAFTHKKDGVMPFNMETHYEHRRQGIGSNILDHAQRVSKKPVIKSPDMTLDAQMFWHHYINKSGDFTVEISLPIESDLLKSFFSPDMPGDVHPEKGYVAKVHPTMGKLFWHQNDETVKRHEDHINQNAAKFLSSIQSPTHRKAMEMVINHVMQDPHRHFIPTEEHGKQVLRARHIKSLILGGGDVTLDTSDPNALRIKRLSHSQYGNYKPIVFKLALGGKNAVSKSERNDGPGTNGPGEIGWLRSILSVFGRRSGRDLKKNRTFDAGRSRAGFEYLRKTLSEDYKQKARSNAIILHPVTVMGKTSLGSGIPMHMTVKDFGNADNLSEQDMHNIHSLIDSNAFSQPINTENIKLSPYRLRNAKNELQHILLVHNLPKHIYDVFDKTAKYGPQVPNYLHHIRIDDDTYRALKQKGSVLSAKDAGLEFHPAEFRIGHQVVKTYKP